MESYIIILLLLIFTLILFFLRKNLFSKSKSVLPPGPKPWPIIGNIHQLGDKPHLAVAELSKTYGPIMSLKLGCITTIVISSPRVAKEIFLKHDLALSGRSVPHAVEAGDHGKYSMVWLPVCPKWRELRKIATIQLFTTQRLDASQVLRYKKVQDLVEYAQQCCDTGSPVDIGKAGFTTTLNLLSNTCFSTDLISHTSSKSGEFRELIWEALELAAKPNVSDFFPLVKCLDLQGLFRRTKGYFFKIMGTFEEIIDARLNDPNAPNEDVLGTLLKLVMDDDEKFSLDDLKHLIMDLFIAGTDTTSTTLEWAMTELLRNPKCMVKAQAQIDEIIGRDRSIQESDLSKLPYIQAIVEETLRLHPPAPFLIPHKAEKSVELLCGYYVPKNAQIWINLRSIGRDTSTWSDPMLFFPERFLNRDKDRKGQDFGLIPFGAGRRICPGMPLAHRMVHLTLATLLQSFDWKYHDEMGSKDIDMEEKFGITVQKARPLLATPLPRQLSHNFS